MPHMDEAIVGVVAEAPNGIPTEVICRRLGLPPQALGDAFEALLRNGRVRGFAGLWFLPGPYEAAVARFIEALRQEHAKAPQHSGLFADRVAKAAGLPWSGKPLDRIVADLVNRRMISESNGQLRDLAFAPKLTDKPRRFLDRILEVIESQPVNVPNPFELSKILHAPIQAVSEGLRVGVQVGELIEIGDGIYYTPRQLDTLQRNIKSWAGGRSFNTVALRDELRTSRKYVSALLEYFEEHHVTVRDGEKRRFA